MTVLLRFVVLLFLIIGIGLSCTQPLPTDTTPPDPTPQPTSIPTTRPEPTPAVTPVSTATSVPTATPVPAATPVPTAIPAPVSTATTAPTPVPTSGPLSPSEIFIRVSPSLAFIDTPTGTGSGVLIEGGYVLTNAHVVWPFEIARVTFPDGSEFLDAPVMNTDPLGDLAIIGPLDTEIPRLKLIDGEGLVIGSELFLIGYPAEGEQFPHPTFTRGILSRLREWEALGMTYFQTDAAIAGGQSGGALVSAEGKVVGISGFKFTQAPFGLVASAADVLPRVESLIAGKDIAGLGDRQIPLSGGKTDDNFDLQHFWGNQAFVVNEPAGTAIDIRVAGENDAYFFLMDSSGNNLILAGDGTPGVDNGFTGEEFGSANIVVGGPHFVVVGQFTDELGEFQISSNRGLSSYHDPDDGPENVTALGGRVKVGETKPALMDYPGDVDYFVISLTEGETIDITIDSMNIDPFLQVVYIGEQYIGDPIVQVVSDDNGGGGIFNSNAKLTYQAPKWGTYLIVVNDASLTAVGGYFVTVAKAPPGAVPVEIPLGPDIVDSPYGAMVLYESAQHSFSIPRPAFWTEQAKDQPQLVAHFISDTGEQLAIVEEETLASDGAEMSLEKYVDTVLAIVESLTPGFELISRENLVTAQGLPAEILTAGAVGDLVRLKRFIVIHDNRISFSAGYLVPKERFAELEPLIDYSFSTFRIEGLPAIQATPSPTPASVPVPTATPDPVGAQSAFREAMAFFNESEFQKAIDQYSEAIGLDPGNKYAFWNRGISYGRLGQYHKTLSDHTEALRLDPENEELYFLRGLDYQLLGQYSRAIDDYDEAIRLAPRYVFAFSNRGYSHLRLGQFELAIQSYSEAIRLAAIKNKHFYYTHCGDLYEEMGKYQRAVMDYDAAIRSNPLYALAYAHRAMVYTYLSRDTEAGYDVEKAADLGYDRVTLEREIEAIKSQR